MRRSTACIFQVSQNARRQYELCSRALDRDDGASTGGEAGDQFGPPLDTGTELRRKGLAHAQRFDLVAIGTLGDEVGLDALGAPLGKLLIVFMAAHPVGMPFD